MVPELLGGHFLNTIFYNAKNDFFLNKHTNVYYVCAKFLNISISHVAYKNGKSVFPNGPLLLLGRNFVFPTHLTNYNFFQTQFHGSIHPLLHYTGCHLSSSFHGGAPTCMQSSPKNSHSFSKCEAINPPPRGDLWHAGAGAPTPSLMLFL